MAAKSLPRASRQKKPADRVPAPFTLADLVVRWKEGDETKEMRGSDLLWWVYYARARHPFLEGHVMPGNEGLRVKSSLDGLGVLVFPDAGEPVEELDRSRRFFVSETLREIGATVEAEALYRADNAKSFTLHIATGAGLPQKATA